MVSYLPEIRAGMALLLAFCAMVQDLQPADFSGVTRGSRMYGV